MKGKTIIKNLIPTPLINYRRHIIFESIRKKEIASISMSQAGQDYWVYGEVFNEKKNGFFLDIGSHDGVYINNTFLLEKRYNWDGICIEANPDTFQLLESNRDCKCINKCISNKKESVRFALRGKMGGMIGSDFDNSIEEASQTITIQTVPLEELLRQEEAPSVIDYLSIDVEGAEDCVLLEFPFGEYIFNCITIERPSDQLREVLKTNGYILIKEIPGLDCFFIHKSFKKEYRNNLFQFGNKRFLMKRWGGDVP